MRHLLSILDLPSETLAHLVNEGMDLIANNRDGRDALKGRVVGIYFRQSSTRTRTSFTVGAMRLGASVVTYGPADLQLVTGESASDTARVLSSYMDALVIRTNDSLEEMQEMAQQTDMAIINAMSVNEHPTQVVGDLITLREAFGRLEGIELLYIGEGNNTAASLALAVAKTPGARLTLVTPEGYGLHDDILEAAHRFAAQYGSVIEQHHRVDLLPRNVDAIYTTRWETMGVAHTQKSWRAKFEPYRVTPALMAAVSKPEGTVFLHDLPAIRGSEVLDEVLDGPQSLAFRQARHKLTAAMAVLRWSIMEGSDRQGTESLELQDLE